MSEFDTKKDKRKSFVASDETIQKINKIIEQSGKEQGQFFEELVNQLAANQIMNDESIDPNLRTHFESDFQKLKNATNSILSLFTSQMDNIKVEKDRWEKILNDKLEEKQEQITKLTGENTSLKEELDTSKHELTELSKVNESIQKEIDVLSKRTADQEQLIQVQTEKTEEMQVRINKLNETIVDKDEQLKLIEPIKEELAATKQNIQSLQQEQERLNEKHKEEMKKQKEALIFSCEKEKHQAMTTLKDQFTEEKEKIRNEVRKETEKNIREFYLMEIERKEAEARIREDGLKEQIKQKESEVKIRENELVNQIKQLQQQLEEKNSELNQLHQQNESKPKRQSSSRTKKEE